MKSNYKVDDFDKLAVIPTKCSDINTSRDHVHMLNSHTRVFAICKSATFKRCTERNPKAATPAFCLIPFF